MGRFRYGWIVLLLAAACVLIGAGTRAAPGALLLGIQNQVAASGISPMPVGARIARLRAGRSTDRRSRGGTPMHPFGFLVLLLAGARRSNEAPRRFAAEESLPPIDDATIRAWRTWARGGSAVIAPGVTAPRPVPHGSKAPQNGRRADGRA